MSQLPKDHAGTPILDPSGGVGSQGPQGTVGSQGPQGTVGSQGPQGTVGSQGPQGATGAQGPQGATGAQGPQGATGSQGPQGPQGATGASGSTARTLVASSALFPSATFPQLNVIQGTNFPVDVLQYDAAADEAAFWDIAITGYTSGDVTVNLDWYSNSATSGNVVWSVAVAAMTPSVDAASVETKTFATAITGTSAASGTAKAPVRATLTVTGASLDSLANGDDVWIRIRRDGSSGSDTMTGDANLIRAIVTWS